MGAPGNPEFWTYSSISSVLLILHPALCSVHPPVCFILLIVSPSTLTFSYTSDLHCLHHILSLHFYFVHPPTKSPTNLPRWTCFNTLFYVSLIAFYIPSNKSFNTISFLQFLQQLLQHILILTIPPTNTPTYSYTSSNTSSLTKQPSSLTHPAPPSVPRPAMQPSNIFLHFVTPVDLSNSSGYEVDQRGRAKGDIS